MDDYKLLGKDEVREIMGGCSDQMVRSARLPASMLPVTSSMPSSLAPASVIMLSTRSGSSTTRDT